LFAVPCWATDYFMDASCATPGDGTGGDCDGDADDAFDNLSDFDAVEVDGDVLWVRRTKTETFSADYAIGSGGSSDSPNYVVGWPRDAIPDTTITQATWTNGSTTVDDIVGITIDREQHQGRWATAPDGFDYLITLAPVSGNADALIIDRPYQGATASTTDGKFAIKADSIPIGVSQPSDPNSWDSDADDLPLFDLSGGAYSIQFGQADGQWLFQNLAFKNATDNTITEGGSGQIFFDTCLFQVTNDSGVFSFSNGSLVLESCIMEGSGAGTSQRGIFIKTNGQVNVFNSAIYNMGDNGIYHSGSSTCVLKNVNIGVEAVNGDNDIEISSYAGPFLEMYDTKLGGTNGDVVYSWDSNRTQLQSGVISVNHNKILGSFWKKFHQYIIEKEAVTGTNANKKLSDNIIAITPPTSAGDTYKEVDGKFKVFGSRKTYDAGTYNVKVWIYNDTGNTLNDTTATDDIMLRCRSEAAGYGDATTEYVSKWYYSDEIDIEDAADADDWDYLQADSVVVDVNDAHIYCEVLVSFYDADADNVFIDPVTVNP
jgi:hypothetical protein